MSLKKKYKLGDREIMGQEIPFEAEKEAWNIYLLEDGTTLKLRAVVASVIRLDEYLTTGEPIYMVNASNIVATDVPEGLKRQG